MGTGDSRARATTVGIRTHHTRISRRLFSVGPRLSFPTPRAGAASRRLRRRVGPPSGRARGMQRLSPRPSLPLLLLRACASFATLVTPLDAQFPPLSHRMTRVSDACDSSLMDLGSFVKRAETARAPAIVASPPSGSVHTTSARSAGWPSMRNAVSSAAYACVMSPSLSLSRASSISAVTSPSPGPSPGSPSSGRPAPPLRTKICARSSTSPSGRDASATLRGGGSLLLRRRRSRCFPPPPGADARPRPGAFLAPPRPPRGREASRTSPRPVPRCSPADTTPS